MGDVENLSVKAARLWLEFLQAQAKAAASVAQKLPEIARAWAAETGAALAAEAQAGIDNKAEQPHKAKSPDELPAHEEQPLPRPLTGSTGPDGARPALLVRANHRRLKPMQKSLAKRRMRRS
jgi:hypothetical protein